MEMTIKERILLFIRYHGMKMKEFEGACGLSTGYVTSMRKGLGSEKLNNVLKAFPDLNRDWLVYGEGSMLKSKDVRFEPVPTMPTNAVVGDHNSHISMGNTTITPGTQSQAAPQTPEERIRELELQLAAANARADAYQAIIANYLIKSDTSVLPQIAPKP